MLVKLAIILPLVIILLWKLSGLLKMSGLNNKHVGFLGLFASAILTCITMYNRQSPLQQRDTVVTTTQKTKCNVLTADIRESKNGEFELWLRVAWKANGESYQVENPVQWLIQSNSSSADRLADYAAASQVDCRYAPDRPSEILPDAVPILEEAIEAFQWKFIVCIVIASLSLRAIVISYRRRERAVSATRLRSAWVQVISLGVCALVLIGQPIGTWFWGSTAALSIGAWIWVIWRDYEQELKLLPAIKDRMDEHAHWPPTRTPDSGVDLYGDDRIQGIWNSVTVRIALGNDNLTLEADVPNWPDTIFLGRRGSRPSKPSLLGDIAFDNRMHLESDQGATNDYALQVLTPAARETVLRAMDELGAALEDRTLTATLKTDIPTIVVEQFEDIIEAARVMNLPPLPQKNRLAIETNPVLKLRLAKLQTPIPLDVIKSIQDDELAPFEVRRDAFSLLNPGEEASGLLSLSPTDGQVSTIEDEYI